MSASQIEECSICEEQFNDNDDLVTTTCNHKFHRTCAEKRVKNRNKSDCRVCKQPSALVDALRPNETNIRDRCSICKEAFNPKLELVTTSCHHTFHRTCAKNRLEKRNKSDCRVCKQPSALADALLPYEPSVGEECSICEEVLKPEEDLVITSCRHTFHRNCAENRVKTQNRSDCRVCKKPSVVEAALLPNQCITESECSICEEPLDYLVTTSCRHTFHRACVKKCLNEDNQTDCYVCHKQAALVDALQESTTMSKRDDTQQISIQTQSIQNVSSLLYY